MSRRLSKLVGEMTTSPCNVEENLMIKKYILTALLIFCIACPAGCHRRRKHKENPVEPSNSTGRVELKVIPPDAAVIVDGKLVGNAWDIQQLNLIIGVHTIEIRKEGYEPFRGKVIAGATPILEIELKKLQ